MSSKKKFKQPQKEKGKNLGTPPDKKEIPPEQQPPTFSLPWEYANQLQHQPAYCTSAAEGKGFCELVRYLLKGTTVVDPQANSV